MFGMREFASFREIIDLWPTRTELARQMSWGLRVVSAANVRVMYQRDRIRPGRFAAVLRAAKHAGFDDVTLAELERLHKTGRRPAPMSSGT
jgi:hypothetical protein